MEGVSTRGRTTPDSKLRRCMQWVGAHCETAAGVDGPRRSIVVLIPAPHHRGGSRPASGRRPVPLCRLRSCAGVVRGEGLLLSDSLLAPDDFAFAVAFHPPRIDACAHLHKQDHALETGTARSPAPAASPATLSLAVLCCAVLCCAVLCCAVLCCAVLCCAVSLPCRRQGQSPRGRIPWLRSSRPAKSSAAGGPQRAADGDCGLGCVRWACAPHN
jgi:hypothetical protein